MAGIASLVLSTAADGASPRPAVQSAKLHRDRDEQRRGLRSFRHVGDLGVVELAEDAERTQWSAGAGPWASPPAVRAALSSRTAIVSTQAPK